MSLPRKNKVFFLFFFVFHGRLTGKDAIYWVSGPEIAGGGEHGNGNRIALQDFALSALLPPPRGPVRLFLFFSCFPA